MVFYYYLFIIYLDRPVKLNVMINVQKPIILNIIDFDFILFYFVE
jgi:hypothetical protein